MTEQDGHRSTTTLEIRDHAHALRVVFDYLADSLGKVEAVGHRVVQGGDRFVQSMLITEQVEADIDALSELAPLHNPSCLAVVAADEETWIAKETVRCLRTVYS